MRNLNYFDVDKFKIIPATKYQTKYGCAIKLICLHTQNSMLNDQSLVDLWSTHTEKKYVCPYYVTETFLNILSLL